MIRHFISTVVLLVLSFHICAGHHYRYHRYRRGGEAVHRNNELTAEGSLGLLAAYPVAACGLEYKRYFGHDGRFTASCLLSAYDGGSFELGEQHQYDTRTRTYGYFAVPGAQYHFRNRRHGRMIDIGIGPSLALGRGSRDDDFPGNNYKYVRAINHAFFGALIAQVDFNFHFPESQVIFGLFLNAGYIFSDVHTTVSGAADDPAYAHFGLRLGGKW